MAGLREGVCGGEAAETCADNNYIEAECGTAAVIEWRDFLDGDVSSDLRWGVEDALHCESVILGEEKGQE